jgi:hypothetical protein
MMKLKQGTEAEYESYKSKNNDAYGGRVVSYGEDWANLMEKAMADGATVEQCAKATSREADTDGITGFMYGCAVPALSHFWEHGEALRRWHNLDCQIGTEGEKANDSGTVLNPALITIGDKTAS